MDDQTILEWQNHQAWEASWWGSCANTFWEETKQQVYARKMGFLAQNDQGKFPVYFLNNISVLDVGGGPVSLLLKCRDVKGVVVDPCPYPQWVKVRYAECGIDFKNIQAEEMEFDQIFDEVWCYNVLQHVLNPTQIINKMRTFSKLIRLFEWVDTPQSPGHPHILKEVVLNNWLSGEGKVERLNENGCVGNAYFGIFKGDHYEKV